MRRHWPLGAAGLLAVCGLHGYGLTWLVNVALGVGIAFAIIRIVERLGGVR